ncbi:MAG: restriction endonuclease subunit S [Varibaculum cambriense]|nr:restriction endonuclease subunit S [Varibaculum cambriense]
MRLKDVCAKVSSGGTPKRNVPGYFGGSIPWLRTQDVNFNEIFETSATITELGLKNSSASWVKENSIVIAMYGATAAKTAVAKIPLTTNQACCNLEINSAVANYRYVFHVVSNNYDQLKSLGRGSQSNINASIIKQYEIPVPPLAEQERIVAILDKFDALVNDLSSGLPAEIAARRKQYEYYRDRLLTFTPAK